MKKSISLLLIVMIIGIIASACTSNNLEKTKETDNENNVSVKETSKTDETTNEDAKVSSMRTITGVNGENISLPPAEDIKRVVIMTPPTLSMVLDVIPNNDIIVGVNNRAFEGANAKILNDLFPKWENVETSFMPESFTANIEELLKLKPDIIFYYGQMQKPGLENVNVPLVDMMIKNENDPEKITIAYDKLLREIFNVKSDKSIANQWNITNKKLEEILEGNNDKKTGLYVVTTMGDKVNIFGSNSFVDELFNKVDLKNVALEVEDYSEVSMEQIYEWNPDYIFLFSGMPAKEILNAKDSKKDWTKLTAYKEGHIYDIPETVFSLGAPSSDSPLMPLWLSSKCYMEKYSELDFKNDLKRYYKEMHNIELSSELIDEITAGRKVE